MTPSLKSGSKKGSDVPQPAQTKRVIQAGRTPIEAADQSPVQRATFEDYICRTSSDGNQRFTYGLYVVYCAKILDDAPQDWSLGPKMVPGQWGIFFQHLWYDRRHGRYAVATGKTPDEAKSAASGLFRARVGPDGRTRSQAPIWELVDFSLEESVITRTDRQNDALERSERENPHDTRSGALSASLARP